MLAWNFVSFWKKCGRFLKVCTIFMPCNQDVQIIILPENTYNDDIQSMTTYILTLILIYCALYNYCFWSDSLISSFIQSMHWFYHFIMRFKYNIKSMSLYHCRYTIFQHCLFLALDFWCTLYISINDSYIEACT